MKKSSKNITTANVVNHRIQKAEDILADTYIARLRSRVEWTFSSRSETANLDKAKADLERDTLVGIMYRQPSERLVDPKSAFALIACGSNAPTCEGVETVDHLVGKAFNRAQIRALGRTVAQVEALRELLGEVLADVYKTIEDLEKDSASDADYDEFRCSK